MQTREETEREIVTLVAHARRDGWYEDDPEWHRVDDLLAQLGLIHQ